MNRDLLARRNQEMAHALHRTAFKHKIRNTILRWLSQIPISQQKPLASERILVIRPDHIGDVLLTTPALHALRHTRPKAEIHALVGPWSAAILETYDEVDVVLTLPFPGFDRSGRPINAYVFAYSTGRQLRKIGYSSALILRPDHWWGAMVAYFAGIPSCVGYQCIASQYFLTQSISLQHEHAILQNLRLVEAYTGRSARDDIVYYYDVSMPDVEQSLSMKLKSYGLARHLPFVVLHPGAGTQIKQWTIENWAAVGDYLREEMGINVVITGSAQEIALAKRIADTMDHEAYVLAGQTSLHELALLLKQSHMVVGVDSGPLHLAAAVGTATVSLFGPADPVEFAPWGSPKQHIVLTGDMACRPCRILDWRDDNAVNHPCMRDISVEEVLQAIGKQLM